MRITTLTLRAGWLLGMIVSAGMSGQVPAAPPHAVPALRRMEMLPVVEAAAQRAQVPVAKIAETVERAGLRRGDSVTTLVSHVDGAKTRQWIVILQADQPTAKDAAKVPPEQVIHSSSGRTLRIVGQPGALTIRVMGPFAEGEKGSSRAKDRQTHTPVNQAFLALGLDRACEMIMRLDALEKMKPGEIPKGFGIGFNTRPFPSENWAATRSVLDRLGVTEAEESAFSGSFPALVMFLQIAAQTPGLDEVLRSVVDISWTSLLMNGGSLNPEFEYLEPFVQLPALDWGLYAGAKCYSFKFQVRLNKKPALNCQMAVTAPRPPLLANAGIVGFAAQRPDGKGPVLLMHVVDARCAEEVASAVTTGAADRSRKQGRPKEP